MVGWATQEEVLAHHAVDGFLTDNGWNSTLESEVAGQPMICWPYFADQQVNSRFVGEVWRLRLDMKDVCDRKVVEKMVNDLMVDRREEFVKSTNRMANCNGYQGDAMDGVVELEGGGRGDACGSRQDLVSEPIQVTDGHL
ncbi:hypothetical protein EZV62_025755 [Acer yangbiense]|uniref:Uncharacterized protein n=1 Tax=Acer yangbiense TaxID=1000413 RepID=A0A5C7GYQ6_9ROSI|nr:hypothetical protein EZV62_025755 [Acer yangbiense]